MLEGSPDHKISLREETKQGLHIVFGVPGECSVVPMHILTLHS